MKRTQSLRFRITLFSSAAILCCILIIGSIGIFAVKREGDRDTSRQMNLICDDSAKSLNEFLESVEQSAGLVARYIADDISSIELVRGGVVGADGVGEFHPRVEPDAEARAQFEEYLTAHTERTLAVFRSAANYTHGIHSFFYRLNPQFSGRDMGFLYAKKDQSSFRPLALTDLRRYGEEDEGFTKWYYTPLRSGGSVWMLPYYNEYLGTEILSYAIPVYKSNTFLGVVGIDIEFSTLVEQVRSIRLFESGYAYLALENGEIIWHPFLNPGKAKELYTPDHAPLSSRLMEAEGTEESTISYVYEGQTREMAFNTLSNGMRLVVVAPSEEINAEWHRLILWIVIVGFAVMAGFSSIMALGLQRVTTPLRRLTEASRLLADGNYDVELNYNRNDEVGILTEAFRKLTEHLKIYISDLNSRVYKDALTGVRNKGAFDIYLRKLDDAAVAAEGDNLPWYAIAMLDCDCLKEINDLYGHEKGDLYLRTACRHICTIFDHSPVFRIGGDEFAVILEREDLRNRESLCAEFERSAKEHNARFGDPWDQIRISMGLAVYDRNFDPNAGSVLARADAMMYEEKRLHKHRI